MAIQVAAQAGVAQHHRVAAALDKGFLIIEALTQGPSTVLQVANWTGLNRSTVHRLLHELEPGRFVVQDLRGRYFIGPRFSEIVTSQLFDSVQKNTEAILAALMSDTGGDAVLFRADGLDRVCLHVCPAAEVPTRSELKVGARLAVSPCASALVLLAWSANRRLGARHLQIPAQHYDRIRKQGWAVSTGGDGINVIAAPVSDRLGETIAAIAIFGAEHLTKTTAITSLAAQVVSAAKCLRLQLA